MSESPVIAFLNKMTDLILLNLLWMITCLPIVTIGAATTAMYYTNIISIRQGDGYVVKRYFKSFRDNFKQATILWLLILLVGGIMAFDLIYWYTMGTMLGKVMFCLSAVVAFFIFIILIYVFPVLAKFDNGIKKTIKTAAAFAVGYFPYTAILVVLTILFIYFNAVSVIVNAISLFAGFAVFAYVKSFFLYKVFMNHMDEKYDDFYSEDEK